MLGLWYEGCWDDEMNVKKLLCFRYLIMLWQIWQANSKLLQHDDRSSRYMIYLLQFNYIYVIKLNINLPTCLPFQKELFGIKIFLFGEPWFKHRTELSLGVFFCLFICKEKTDKHKECAGAHIVKWIVNVVTARSWW